MGGPGFPSLVVLSVELICSVTSFAEFSILIVVYNIGVQSFRIDLCSLYSITCCSCLFAFFFTHCKESGRLLQPTPLTKQAPVSTLQPVILFTGLGIPARTKCM